MKRICIVYFFLATLFCMEGRSMEINGSRILLPDSYDKDYNVIGTVFYEDKGMFFVQQLITSTENNGLVFRHDRQLSSWNLANQSMIAKRMFDRTPSPDPGAFPCGRVEKSVKLHKVFLCSAVSHLEVINPDSLATVGTLARADDQIIMDFAVDDQRDRIFVLSIRKGNVLNLSSYSMSKGEKQQETTLPSINFSRMMSLAIAPQTGAIGIYVNIIERNRSKADIYICTDSSSLACKKTAQTHSASQISFLERQLLVVTNNFANNKKDCIVAVDSMTGQVVSRAYCSPTGVHYALGVVEGKYVVGFTGKSKRIWFLEENRSVSSSFSVWRAGVSQVAAVVQDPNDYGSFQALLMVEGSNTNPFFIVYRYASNMLYLYSIRE